MGHHGDTRRVAVALCAELLSSLRSVSSVGMRITPNAPNMGGASIYCQRVLVTSGFNVTFNIRFGPITGPADVVYLSFFQSSNASAVPAWTCGSLGGGGCYSSLNRVALQLVTYGTLTTGAAASSSGFVNDASGFSLIGVSNAGSFGASTSIAAGDV